MEVESLKTELLVNYSCHFPLSFAHDFLIFLLALHLKLFENKLCFVVI